ncbi:MAG: type II toxin-antitoxin system VapC family toxin [Spirochaetaceae bacterium]|nr:type II toxin-antitoxin system VapC family toxin [Spirochaetaceae bacterium]
MISVIDASGAIEIALYKERAQEFKRVLADSEIVLAPDLFVSEVTNAFWKYRTLTEFSEGQCVAAIQFCLEMVDDFVSTKELWREAYSQSVTSKHSVYDVFYLIVARRNSARLVTCDKKLKRLATEMQIPIL